jgi:hypothetical protein
LIGIRNLRFSRRVLSRLYPLFPAGGVYRGIGAGMADLIFPVVVAVSDGSGTHSI